MTHLTCPRRGPRRAPGPTHPTSDPGLSAPARWSDHGLRRLACLFALGAACLMAHARTTMTPDGTEFPSGGRPVTSAVDMVPAGTPHEQQAPADAPTPMPEAPTGSGDLQADAAWRPVVCAVTGQVGHSKMRDTYLTPLAYSGTGWGLRHERWHRLRRLQWTSAQHVDLDMAKGWSTGRNSSSWSGRLRYAYAGLHQWAPFGPGDRRLTLSVGPTLGADLGFDYNVKMAPSNNPANVRLCGGVGAAGAAVWHYVLRRQPCSAMLWAQTPLAGAAFMPDYGASYYETFMLQTTGRDAYFTSLHNQQDLDLRLTTDIPVATFIRGAGCAVRLGLSYHIETMRINHITTRYSSAQVVIGWVYRCLPYPSHTSHPSAKHAHEPY